MNVMDINIETRLQQLETLAWRMENLLPIPGTNLRFGLDAVVGMVPVVGDFAALLPGVYIMKAAHDLGASRRMLIRMGLNLAVDVVIGLVPGIWRPVRRGLERQHAQRGPVARPA